MTEAIERPWGGDRVPAARQLEDDADHAERTAVELLQRAALPPHLPIAAGLTIDAVYQPAASGSGIGGDWYDAFVLDDDRVGLVIADVAGHGQEAASFMLQIRNVLRAMAMEHDDPDVVLDRVNAVALSLVDHDGPFITCLYAVLDPLTRRLAYAKAGHFDPLIVPSEGRPFYPSAPNRPPLTVRHDPGYVTLEMELDPGDRMLLFTDGLIERRGETIDDGLDRLADRADVSRSFDSTGCLESVLGIVDQQSDDLAVICVDVARR